MKKLLIGCGILVAIVIVLGIGASIFVVSYFKKQLPDSERYDAQHEELVARFGEVDDWMPALDGVIAADRVGRFLDLREELQRAGEPMGHSLGVLMGAEEAIEAEKGFGKMKRVLGVVGEGLGFARESLEYMATRDSLMLSYDVGPGEYVHLYAWGVESWLEWDPDFLDGPDVDADAEEFFGSGRRELRSVFKRQLRAQQQALIGLDALDPAERAWLTLLDQELDEGRVGSRSFPFAGAVPPQVLAGFTPHRGRLEASLPNDMRSLAIDVITVLGIDGLEDDNGNFSFKFD